LAWERREMNRSAKRHRSTKVPNVKLRPAPVGTSAASERRRQEAEAEKEDLAHYRRLRELERTGRGGDDDSEDDDNDNDAGEDDVPPLTGAVICMTGITDEKVSI
jgi:DNA replication regulator DPB11